MFRVLTGPVGGNDMKPPPLETLSTEALAVDVLIESEAWQALPEAEDVARRAIAVAAASTDESQRRNAELSVLFCDDETIAVLNGQWRGQEKPTNVLSFPALPLPGASPHDKAPLGDIAIAYETLVREAAESGKTASAHLSHLVVHGFLHLVGFDHQIDDEAERMERLERDILARIGVADPYAARDADI
jgi:probable rRNA maturation factor